MEDRTTLPIGEAVGGAEAFPSNVTHPVGQIGHELGRNKKSLERIKVSFFVATIWIDFCEKYI